MDYSFLWFAIASGVIVAFILGARIGGYKEGWEFLAFISLWCLGASILVLLASV